MRARVRDGAHGEEQLFEEPPGDGILRDFGRDIEAANQTLLLLRGRKNEYPAAMPFSNATHPARGVRVQEPFDEFERAAVVPMQFVAQWPRFLFEQRLNLAERWFVANRRCSWMAGNPARPCRENTIIADSLRPSGDGVPRVIQIRHKGRGFRQWGEGGVLGCQLLRSHC